MSQKGLELVFSLNVDPTHVRNAIILFQIFAEKKFFFKEKN